MTETYQVTIDRDIPLAPARTMRIYPWQIINVGESFLIKEGTKKPHTRAILASKKYAPKKFVVRKTPMGYRCWRVR